MEDDKIMDINSQNIDENLNDDINDFYKSIEDSSEEWSLDEKMFSDENIHEVVKKYNYDYKYLLREMSLYFDYNKLLEILNTLGISMNEYLNPTYEIFEKIRLYVIKEKILKIDN